MIIEVAAVGIRCEWKLKLDVQVGNCKYMDYIFLYKLSCTYHLGFSMEKDRVMSYPEFS